MSRWCVAGCSLLLLSLAGCSTGPGLDAWFVDPLVKVFPDDPVGANRRSGEPLLMARNEYASLQLAIRSEVEIAELTAMVRAPQADGIELEAEARWVDYVPVGSNPPDTPSDEVIRPAPALYPDPLREGFPQSLEAGRTRAVWITLFCPPEAPPGTYSAHVLVGEVLSREFKVRVVNAAVPAEQTLQVTNWFNFGMGNLRRFYDAEEYSEAYWDLLGNIGRVMARHKQNVMLTPVSSLVEPSLRDGRIHFDFSRLDRWVAEFSGTGLIGTIEGGHLLGRASGYFSPLTVPVWVVEHGRVVHRQLEPDDPRAEVSLRRFLDALYAHLKERGWEGRYIQHIHDEPHDREAEAYRRYALLIRESLPGIPTIDAVSLNQDVSFFADVCDIWVPVLGSFDHRMELIREHVDRGGRAWFYTCVSPQGRYLNRFIDHPLLKTRLLHWFNFRHDLTGYLHWGGNYWGPRPFENVQSVINSNRTLLPAGDHALVYPNPEGNSVLSSIRLEAMRDGIEDFELLVELRRRNPDLARELAASAIPHINDYVRDPAEFRNLHRRLLEAFE